MFKYDFIILYEHRQRELENAVLLAMMLEKKGYKVAIEYRKSVRLLFIRGDVILAPFLYDNGCIKEFVLHPFSHCKKIINMQYEQVFLKKNEEVLGDLPSGCAKNAVHISWGKNTTERYEKIGIEPNHIFEIGHISIDLNMPKYRDVFLSRKDISKELNIPSNKKWLLFISSFSCVGLTKTEYEKWKKLTVTVEPFTKISCDSQPLILDYYEELAKKHPELIIIYRPHPHEDTCRRLKEIKTKYSNFKVITSYSIRQWLIVSDYISTWCSTSLVDILYAQKPCAIVRPIPFLEDYDYNIFRNQKVISKYQDLEAFIKNPDELYHINPEPISTYYCNTYKAETFEKLRDICIHVKNSKEFEFDYFRNLHKSILFLLKLYTYMILLSFAEFIDFSKITPEKYRADVQYVHREMHNYKKEIAFYRKRFLGVLKNEKSQ